jgi:uncharacterized protein YegL
MFGNFGLNILVTTGILGSLAAICVILHAQIRRASSNSALNPTNNKNSRVIYCVVVGGRRHDNYQLRNVHKNMIQKLYTSTESFEKFFFLSIQIKNF